MNIRGIPATSAELEAFNRDFEQRHFRYSEASARVARATRDLFVTTYLPEALKPFGQLAVHALLDEPLLAAFGFDPPPLLLRRTVERALQARALVTRFLPRNEQGLLVQEIDWKTYPHGYVIEELGPESPGREKTGSGEA